MFSLEKDNSDLEQYQKEEKDKSFRFLYEKLNIANLETEESKHFKQLFQESEVLLKITQSFQFFEGMFEELEALLSSEKTEKYLQIKKDAKKEGNVIFVPFTTNSEYGPLIVCMEQSEIINDYAIAIKGMVLSLSILAQRQQRDLYIVPFGENVKTHYLFLNGVLNMEDFQSFVRCSEVSMSPRLLPALQFALKLLKEHHIKWNSQIIFITGGLPKDVMLAKKEKIYHQMQMALNKFPVDMTAVVLENHLLLEEKFWFVNKVYNAKDYFKNWEIIR